MNKNQLRETLRKHIHDAPYLDAGVERIVDQVVNPKVYSVFMPQIEDVVYKFLGIERPKVKERNGACVLKDLLPKDLDPVSPESDKNSLKDVSLESIDASDANDVDGKQFDKVNEQKLQDEEIYREKNKVSPENGHIFLEEKILDEALNKDLNKTSSSLNLNISGKSDDKIEDEDEEVSPTFEPIDIMNLNESNISNDSHLSGISELTSHRSRSPDFSNELSRDNFDCSNQDSQLSKVSSDSRLSIVTDFGSSNHGFTPVHDALKDDSIKDKYEVKSSKDNFKAIGEFDSSKNKTAKSNFDFAKNKDGQDYKDSKDSKSSKSVSSKENSRDATDSGMKDKYEHKSSKEKSRDSESIKSSKSMKEKNSNKDAKYYKERSNERKKSRSHSSEKYDKHNKSKSKEKVEQVRENSDKAKDISETSKDNINKLKDEKLKETEKKDINKDINKEAKDLKDIYKEKIRELREKKELTEKEKLNKDKDVKLTKEAKDKKDPLKDKKSEKSRKEHRSSSSSSSKNIPTNHESRNSKISEKITDGKDKRSDSKDKGKRDERRLSKDNKGKNHYSSKTDLSDKSDPKKVSRSEKEDKGGKVDVRKDSKTSSDKKDAKSYLQSSKNSDRNEKSDGKRDSKNDSPTKDKKRREDKKSKTKDDHSSLRKSSNDRRSTDRDGSNGSNSKTSPSNNTNSNMTSNKSDTSSLTKENSHVSNSGSETSDSIEEVQMSDSKSLQHPNCKLSHKISLINEKNHPKMKLDNTDETQHEEEADSRDTSLSSKKRLLSGKEDESTSDDVKVRKPKFAKNIHEAKKLMKLRKLMEKEKLKEDKKEEKRVTHDTEQTSQSSVTKDADNLEDMPDDERVQIIEIPDEEYEEPYPEKHETNLTLDERSLIMLGAESCTNEFLNRQSKPSLSNIELCIRQSLSEIVSNVPLGETITQNSKIDEKITRIGDMEASEDTGNKTSNVDAEKFSLQDYVLQKQEEIANTEKSESTDNNENKNTEQSTEEKDAQVWDNETETQNNDEAQIDNRIEIDDNNEAPQDEKQMETCASSKIDASLELHADCLEIRSSSSVISEDNGEDCRYFKTDDKKSERFSRFLESLELGSMENSSLEEIVESLGGKVVLSIPKSMAAPPLPKMRKRSSSPLSDILVNNSDNNNDDHKRTLSINEDTVHNVKKRRFNKKPRFSNLCNPQGVPNGENFVMPLSPDSDVSATSEKTASSTVIKEEKRYVLYALEVFM